MGDIDWSDGCCCFVATFLVQGNPSNGLSTYHSALRDEQRKPRRGTRLIAEPNGKKREQVNGQPCGEKLTAIYERQARANVLLEPAKKTSSKSGSFRCRD